MHAYRFRISLEDVDEFYRDIEIKANSTFEEFHNIIKQSVDLEGQELASFFICDGKWNRKKEITLEDMAEEGDLNAPLVMSKVKLAETIDDPHQKLIYVYDFMNMYEFQIELCKIFPTDEKIKYPRCVRKSGIIPKAGVSLGPLPVPEDFDEDVVYESEDTALKDEDDTFGLYTASDVEGGFIEESPEAFEDDRI